MRIVVALGGNALLRREESLTADNQRQNVRAAAAALAPIAPKHELIITHGNGKVEEVEGDGVVGEQPYLRPGDSFEYTSGTILETPFGDMNGSYHMVADDGVEFDADIPHFSLTLPSTLH